MTGPPPEVAMFRDGPTCPWHGPVTGAALLRVRTMGFEVRLISESEAIAIARIQVWREQAHVWGLLAECETELVELTRDRPQDRTRLLPLIQAIRSVLDEA